ncbi:hypothetical protein AB0A71_27775 [Kitasatospora aureofaciens]|uniref:hypothetical protein n=1 Tax=Kitasatospora aureofaciens TaxID=1894 RepID=UPI0033D35DB7
MECADGTATAVLGVVLTTTATQVHPAGPDVRAAAPTATAATPAATPHFEYRWVLAQPGGQISDLNKPGKDGWEVVAPVNEYNGGRWYFLLKRPLAD